MKMSNESPAVDIELVNELKRLDEANNYSGYHERINNALNQVVTKDNNEPLVHLTSATLHPRISVQLVHLGVPSDDVARSHLRYSVVEALNAAAANLAPGYSLIVRDALRTEAIVRALYKLYVSRLRSEKPWLSDWELDLQIRHLLAMPDDPVPPGHMTGGAVDVILGDVDGVRVDLEVPAKQIPRRQQAPTDCPGLPAVIVARRRALCSAMTSQGFHNYFKEYWHFSYGDGYWAVRRKSKVAIYGVAHAPINIDWTQHHDRRRLRHIASRSASQTSVAANF